MTIESLTYAEFGQRLGISPEAARKKARALRLQTALGNDGKKRVSVDLADVSHSARPPRRPAGEQPVSGGAIPAVDMLRLIDELRAETGRKSEAIAAEQNMVRELQARVARFEAALAGQRDLVTAERQRADTASRRADDLSADRDAWREQAQTLAARQSVSWWRRLVG
ncbi:hypothetical protein GCM10019059_43020 [Camelimonas fluminis]|uniref:hypothetical protein n=1 Tax=Camelimonas fluminis TaxID=1576911 RepID=UPI00174A57FC|nr:hypothetical protein [Camelimonas fluminis]GHE80024.1 hypothetical protein GCM10019059_43020 [Camelimonas fluminis]